MAENEAVEKAPKAPTKAMLSQAEADAFTGNNDSFYGDGPWPVLSRAAAILLGFSRYNTGEECKNGHISPRKVKTSTCIACSREKLRERNKTRLANDPDYKAAQAAKAKARRAAKKEEVTA